MDKQQLIDQIGENEKKIKGAKEKYRMALINNLQLDLRIDELERRSIENRYLDFVDKIPIETIHMLRNFGDSEEEDFKFVQQVIQGILKQNEHSLQSATDNPKNMSKGINEKEMIANLFNRRLQYSTESVDDSRKSSLNKHIELALKNINKNSDQCE